MNGGCAPSTHSRMQAFSFRKRTRLPSYQIPPLTRMNSASDQKRQNSQLSNKQLGSGSRSCSQSRFECLLLTANASPVPEWPSSSSCPPARAPGGCSHTQRTIGNHITRSTQSIAGGCSHTRHLCLGRNQHHLSVETIPIHFQSPERHRGVIVSITRR